MIREAAKKGEYSIVVDYDIMTNNIANHYEDLGYNVYDSDDGQYSGGGGWGEGYTINWIS